MDPNTPTTYTPQPEVQKSSKNILLTLLSLLILAIVVGTTLYLYIQNKQSPIAKKNDTAQQTAQKNTILKKDSITPTPYIPTTVEDKKMAENVKKYGVVCKRFTSLKEALKTPNIACQLDLSGNGLKEVPEDVVKLNSLIQIILKDNKFESFPEILFTIKSLNAIDISNNDIKEMVTIPKNSSIHYVVLTGNPIKNRLTPTPTSSQKPLSGTPPPPISEIQIVY